jgi:hypothetical protein
MTTSCELYISELKSIEGRGMTWSTTSEKRETYLMVFALTLSTKDEVLPEKCIWRSDS